MCVLGWLFSFAILVKGHSLEASISLVLGSKVEQTRSKGKALELLRVLGRVSSESPISNASLSLLGICKRTEWKDFCSPDRFLKNNSLVVHDFERLGLFCVSVGGKFFYPIRREGHVKYGKVGLSVLLLASLAAESVFAQGCATYGYAPVPDATVINGYSIYAQNVPPGGVITEDWKEDHCTTGSGNPGNLYKVGDGTTVDPRALRGTWTPNPGGDMGTVEYNYDGNPPGNPYKWTLYARKGISALCWEDTVSGQLIATGNPIGSTGTCP